MDSYAMTSSFGKDAEQPEFAGSETSSDETYCSDQLNVSANSCDCTGYFDIPECVTDIYLLALDGGDESNAGLRQISDLYGTKNDEKEINTNCNHNVKHEPCPNEGCGCTGSYNGGAGAGTAVCCCTNEPYEPGFRDKKRDPICCGCCEDTYQTGLVNKKPECSDNYKYVPVLPGPPPPCPPKDSCCHVPLPPKTSCCPFEANTYQRPGAKSHCQDKYVPVLSPPAPYCSTGDSSCCASSCSTQQKSPDRTTFYIDERCDCPRRDTSCNNNISSQ